MKGKYFSGAAFAGIFLLAGMMMLVFGCKKTDYPFGLYAPHGLDVPTPTPTPTSGSFNIYVIDAGVPTGGMTCFLVDPLGNSYNAVTQPVVGYAPFSISNVINGTWKAGVYTQGHYFLSGQPVTVSNNAGQNINFTAQSQTLQITPTTLENYPTGGGSVGYKLIYNQVGNLSVPVSLGFVTVGGNFPGSWSDAFTPNVLG